MRTSETIADLAAALAKAQGQIRGSEKDRENPHFRSQYSTLDATWKACREPLSSNGLSVVQGMDGDRLDTRLLHASGQWIESSAVVQLPSDPQKAGSALTYYRRYYLASLVGVAPTDDDDGEAAAAPPKKAAKPSAAPAGGETPEQRAQQFYARIDALTSEPEINRWVQKWASEINALPEALANAVKSSVRARREQVGPYTRVADRDGPPAGGER